MPDNPQQPKIDHEQMARNMMLAAPHTLAERASGGTWKAHPHLKFLSRQIVLEIASANARYRRDPDHNSGARIIINMGPRMGKSELISNWLPTWYLTVNPHQYVMMISHMSDLAEGWGRKVRDNLKNHPELGVDLREDVSSVSTWMTTKGGGMISAGINTGIMGKGFHLGIIDDPHKDEKEASSPTILKDIRNWFGGVFYTRKMPGAHIIILHQRWNCFDLTAFLTKEHPDPWKVIRLPSIAEPGDPMGRQPGDPLCPELVTINDLNQFAKAPNKELVFDAMHQQNPRMSNEERSYYHFHEANLNKKMPPMNPSLPLRLTLDFNVNPGMHALISQYCPVTDMCRVYQELHGYRMKTEQVMDEFEKWVIGQGGWKWPEGLVIHGDRSGRNETTNTSVTDYHVIQNKIEAMNKKHKWEIKTKMCVPLSNPPIKHRVDTVNDALRDGDGVPHLEIDPIRCPRLVADLEFIMTGPDGLPDKETNPDLTHAVDALGYQLVWIRPVRRMKFTPQRQVH